MRSAFFLDPEILDFEEYTKLLHQAVWLKKYEADILAAALSKIFAE